MVGKFRPIFPMIGKIFRPFSNDWKKYFQPLENFLRRAQTCRAVFHLLASHHPARFGRPTTLPTRATLQPKGQTNH
jgi:hypothetical protein